MITENRKSWPLLLSFLLFSMVLNCLGIVILQLSRTTVSYGGLGALEAFKDLPIAATSVIAANYISKFGARISLSASLFSVAVCAALLPFVSAFWFYKIWFALVGVAFSVGKISVYGIIKNNFGTEKSLSRVMNRTEASFMAGIFIINISFGGLISSRFSEYWRFGFLAISIFSAFVGVLVLRTKYTEADQKLQEPTARKLLKVINKETILFFLIIFLIVFAEQGFYAWLPSFFRKNLGVSSYFALQSAAFLALFSFGGRLLAARFSARFRPEKIILNALFLVLIILFGCQIIVSYFPDYESILLLLFPLAGFFSAPLYPLFNSWLIYKTAEENVNVLVSAVVIFSSLGSSVGSLVTAALFDHLGAEYFSGYLGGIFCCILFLTMIARGKPEIQN